jgi:hypothetical protein
MRDCSMLAFGSDDVDGCERSDWGKKIAIESSFIIGCHIRRYVTWAHRILRNRLLDT